LYLLHDGDAPSEWSADRHAALRRAATAAAPPIPALVFHKGFLFFPFYGHAMVSPDDG